MNANDNPLLDFSGLPRFDAIRPEHVTPAVDHAARRTRARPSSASQPTRPTPDVVHARRADRRHARPLRSRVERRASSQRRRQHAGAARCVQREPAEGDRVLQRPLRRTCACTASIARCARRTHYAALDSPQRKLVDNELRDFKLGGAELADADKARSRPMQEELGGAVHALRGEPARRDQRMGPLRRGRERSLRGVPARRGRRGARRGASRGHAAAGSSRCACRATCR